MTKYKKYYQEMWDAHKDVLQNFLDVHLKYAANRKAHLAEFNTVGKEARAIMEEWDQRLCQQMERGKNSVFSSKVSEKFWAEVKTDFPLIDFVGVEILH